MRSLVFSGPMFAGKTTLASLLRDNNEYVLVSARETLQDLAKTTLGTRIDLQRFGHETEATTKGAWLGNAASLVARASSPNPVVVDSARTNDQVRAVVHAIDALHVHITAPWDVLEHRFRTRVADLLEPSSFEEAMRHPVERESLLLGSAADLVIDSGSMSPEELLQEVTKLSQTS